VGNFFLITVYTVDVGRRCQHHRQE